LYIILGIVFICIGFIMLIKPQIVFHITEDWKSDNNNEPSNLYIISTRFGGVMVLIVGLLAIVIQFF